MLVSICIPTYKRPGLLREAVESVLGQTYRPIDIVVSDDSPDDETERRIADLIACGTVRYVRNAPSLGQAANCNRLLDLARGDLLMLLHDDDLLVADAMSHLVRCFEEQDGLTAAYGKQYVVSEDGTRDEAASASLNAAYRRSQAFAGRQVLPLRSGLTAQFPNDGFLVRTDVARRVRYREAPEVGDACDFDFGLRLSAVADAFYFLDDYTAMYRLTSVGVSPNNNYANLTFDLVAQVAVPGELESERQQQLRTFAAPAVYRWLALGNRTAAIRVYRSAAYGWRRRLSFQGILQAGLMLCPPALGHQVIKLGRFLRGRMA